MEAIQETFDQVFPDFILDKTTLVYTIHNNGLHYIIEDPLSDPPRPVNYWPTTGRWSFQDGVYKGRGIKTLLGTLGFTPEAVASILKDSYLSAHEPWNTRLL